MVFTGTYEQKLDAKNRLSVPSKFRASFENGLVLRRSGRCLQMHPQDLYSERTARRLSDVLELTQEEEDLRRELFARVFNQELDSAGRITLPPKLMARVGITREVTIAGAGNYLELWDRAAWDEAEDDGDPD